ncbi:MAG TPA: hypothetical protein VFQ72_01535 [Candidatus Paceibacterota bacterium]|nr:hypothetical protein [Candidatus Paceibacterota bacterium]
MKTITIFKIAIVALFVTAGAWYLAHRGEAPADSQPSQSVSSGEQGAVEAAARGLGSRLKNVSLMAPAASLAAALDREYGAYVAPELLARWKADPSRALGRQTSNPYPDSLSVVGVSLQPDGSYVVEGNVVETTSADPQRVAAVYPVMLRWEKRSGSWLLVSAEKGASSTLPARVSVTGTQTCLEHRIKTGPQTLECAMGFRADDGHVYALNMSLLSSTDVSRLIGSGVRVRVEGVLTPAETLNTDMWQKYDMEGILSVTSAAAI